MNNLPSTSRNQNVINNNDILYQFIPENISGSSIDFHKYINILKRKKWILVAPAFLILPIVAMSVYIEKPKYQSHATILIEDLSPRILSEIQDVISIDKSQEFFKTQYEIIKSRSIAEEVVDTLQLHKLPKKEDDEIVKKIKYILTAPSRLLYKFKKTITQLIDYVAGTSNIQATNTGPRNFDPVEATRQLVIDQFQHSLIVKPREGTKLVDISVVGENPEDVAIQADMAAQVYIRQNLEKKLDVARKAVVWLSKEEATLRERVHNAELALQDFRARHKLISLDHDERQTIVLQNLSNLNTTYMETKKSRLDVLSKIVNLKSLLQNKDIDNIENYPDILNNDTIKRLREKYLDLKYEYSNNEKFFTEKHPRMILLKSQLQEIKKQISDEIQNSINSMQIILNSLIEKEDTARSMLGEQKKEGLDLKNHLINFNSLTHELEITKDLYLTVSRRLREAKLTEALETNNVKIIQHALTPNRPIPSWSVVKIALGIIAGFGLGAGIAFISDFLDRRFKSTGDIERELGIPLLGVVPYFKTSKRDQLIALTAPRSPASEAYRSIRTWIQLSSPKALQTLIITSAVPHEGKSTTSANLAVTYAQLGRKVLLVDFDLRCPTIHRIFNIANHIGLSDILSGKALWEQTVQNTPLENFKVLCAGSIPPNPAELLSIGRVHELLHVLKGEFDTIICDSPVQLSIPDVAIIAPDVDGVLLVHCPSRVNKEQVLETKKLLERASANIVGIILNNIHKKYQQYYYSYYDEYSYGSSQIKLTEPYDNKSNYPVISEFPNNQIIGKHDYIQSKSNKK